MVNTAILKIDAKSPDKEAIKEAAGVIRKGGLVSFPTETVYGLAADYLNRNALKKLYEVKKRPAGKPFTVHISDLAILDELSCEISGKTARLIKKFWPGPLTLIFKSKNGAKIGVRMPSNRIALDFITACGVPVAAPSANISGEKPPLSAEDVILALNGKIELVLDGGKTEVGIESTVLDVSCEPYKILRKGAISEKEIAEEA